MIKIKILFIFLFISSLLIAQNHRFVYEYTFKIDSLNKENITKEYMNLDISENGSNFYSNEKFIYDSLVNAEFKRAEVIHSNNVDLSKFKKNSQVDFSVTKQYSEFISTLHTSINNDAFAVENSDKIKWNILPESKKLEGFQTQKATTEFGGRQWIAWFTNEIPFQDGPYEFGGLPGLIIYISDEKENHIFKFVESKKFKHMPQPESNVEKRNKNIFEQVYRIMERI